MIPTKEKVLLTGASGYIGKSIYNFLSTDSNIDLYILSRNCSTLNHKNCLSLDKVGAINFDYIINCIGETKNSNLMNDINNVFSKILYNKLNLTNVKKFIHFSTVSVYDQNVVGLINKDSRIKLDSVYASSKFEFDQFLLSQSLLLNKIVILRPSNVTSGTLPNNSITRLSKFGIKFFSIRERYVNWITLDSICRRLISTMYNKEIHGVYILNNHQSLSLFYSNYLKRTYFIFIPVEFIKIIILIFNLKRRIQKFNQLFSLYYFN